MDTSPGLATWKRACAAILVAVLGATPRSALSKQYEVQPGDTLDEIAQLHRVSVEILVKINCLKDPDLIRAGDILTVPNQRPFPRKAIAALANEEPEHLDVTPPTELIRSMEAQADRGQVEMYVERKGREETVVFLFTRTGEVATVIEKSGGFLIEYFDEHSGLAGMVATSWLPDWLQSHYSPYCRLR